MFANLVIYDQQHRQNPEKLARIKRGSSLDFYLTITDFEVTDQTGAVVEIVIRPDYDAPVLFRSTNSSPVVQNFTLTSKFSMSSSQVNQLWLEAQNYFKELADTEEDFPEIDVFIGVQRTLNGKSVEPIEGRIRLVRDLV